MLDKKLDTHFVTLESKCCSLSIKKLIFMVLKAEEKSKNKHRDKLLDLASIHVVTVVMSCRTESCVDLPDLLANCNGSSSVCWHTYHLISFWSIFAENTGDGYQAIIFRMTW